MTTFYLAADPEIETERAESCVFELSVAALLAVLPHRSTEAIRPILNNLYLDPSGALVATDGMALAVYRNGHASPVARVLQADWKEVMRLCKAKGRHLPPVLLVTLSRDSVTLERPGIPTVVKGALLDPQDYPYPEWRRVLPQPESEPVAVSHIALNPEFLARFVGGAKKPRAGLTFTAADRAIVVNTPDPDFYGLLMPCRPMDNTLRPDWLT